MLEFYTADHHGQNVRFSPHRFGQVGCVAGANFGLSGKGSLQVIDFDPKEGRTSLVCRKDWPDVLTDLSWCPSNPDVIATSSGDGFVTVWNIGSTANGFSSSAQEHSREISAIDWGLTAILTSSWDGTVKQWDANSLQSVHTFMGHSELVYDAKWSPWDSKRFATASGDGNLMVWDSRHPPVKALWHGSGMDVLSVDWSPKDEFCLVTGAADGIARIWDLRSDAQPVRRLGGGGKEDLAVRRVKYAGSAAVVTASYDFTTKLWDLEYSAADPEPAAVFRHHTEFVYGLDVHPTTAQWVVDCSWDRTVKMFQAPLPKRSL